MTELDPLLEEEQAPWEVAENDTEAGARGIIRLKELFASKPDEVLRTIQKDGVFKLGEFKVESDVVFAENNFRHASILTLGSEQHADFPYETAWRRELYNRAGKELKKGKKGWGDSVTVDAFVVQIRDAADPDKDGLLQPLLKRWQSGGCSLAVFGLPAVHATINQKWDSFARRLMLGELAIFSIWLISFFLFTWLFQDEDLDLSLGQLIKTPRGLATVGMEAVCLLAMAPFLALEYGTIKHYGVSGWLNIWNGLDILTYVIQISVSIMHIGRVGLHSDILSILLALQCIFLLFRGQYFSRVFKSTRFAFLEAIRDVLYDVKYYFIFLLIIIFGFAAAFHILFRKDQAVSNFDTLPHALLKTYFSQEGLEYEEMLNSHVPVAACCLNFVYAFVMGLVLVNLLIGVLSNSLEKVTEHEALKMLSAKALIIDELEATLPRFVEDYFETEWKAYPAFIHVLRIDPDRIDRVTLNEMWGNTEENGEGQSDKEGSDDELKERLEAIEKQLQLLSSQLGAVLAAGNGGKTGSGSKSGPVTPAVAGDGASSS